MKVSLLHLSLLALLFCCCVQSFAPSLSTGRSIVRHRGTLIFQSTARPNETTEDILIQAAERKRHGLRQEYGLTIKKDGLDELRKVVWFVFEISQVVFTGLGVLLTLGLLLNIMGYGYFFDDHGNFIIQTLEDIRHANMMDAELVRLTNNLPNNLLN